MLCIGLISICGIILITTNLFSLVLLFLYKKEGKKNILKSKNGFIYLFYNGSESSQSMNIEILTVKGAISDFRETLLKM